MFLCLCLCFRHNFSLCLCVSLCLNTIQKLCLLCLCLCLCSGHKHKHKHNVFLCAIVWFCSILRSNGHYLAKWKRNSQKIIHIKLTKIPFFLSTLNRYNPEKEEFIFTSIIFFSLLRMLKNKVINISLFLNLSLETVNYFQKFVI